MRWILRTCKALLVLLLWESYHLTFYHGDLATAAIARPAGDVFSPLLLISLIHYNNNIRPQLCATARSHIAIKKNPCRQLTLILLGSKISSPRAFPSSSNISMPPFIYPKGKTIIKIHLPATSTMLLLLVQFVIPGCAATITSTTNAEDLSQFSKGPELCPGQIGWPQVPVPISCDDPAEVFPGQYLRFAAVNTTA